jgi:hypothetical protein
MRNFKDYLISGLCKSSDTQKDPKKWELYLLIYLQRCTWWKELFGITGCASGLLHAFMMHSSSTGTAVCSYLLLDVTLKCVIAVRSKTLMSMWQCVCVCVSCKLLLIVTLTLWHADGVEANCIFTDGSKETAGGGTSCWNWGLGKLSLLWFCNNSTSW